MSDIRLFDLPIFDVMADDSLLAMWAVDNKKALAFDLGKAWGLSHVTTLFYWSKLNRKRLETYAQLQEDLKELYNSPLMPTEQIESILSRFAELPAPDDDYWFHIGQGYHSRANTEECLLFKKGKGLPIQDHSVRRLINAPLGRHSEKPDRTYTQIEKLYGNVSRLDVFARKKRENWVCIGNEIDGLDVYDALQTLYNNIETMITD